MVVSTNRPKLTNILSGVAIYGGVFVRSGHKVCRTDAFSVRYAHRWSNFNLQAKVKRIIRIYSERITQKLRRL